MVIFNIQNVQKSILSKFYVVLTFTHPSSKMKTTDSSHRVSLLTDRKSRQPDVQRFLRVQWRRQSANLLDEGRQVHRGFGRGAGSGDWDQVRLSKILPVLFILYYNSFVKCSKKRPWDEQLNSRLNPLITTVWLHINMKNNGGGVTTKLSFKLNSCMFYVAV